MDLSCPECGLADRVASVPGVVADGTSFRLGRASMPKERAIVDLPAASLVGTRKHAMTRTQLAVWLSFPARHEVPRARHQGYVMLGFAALAHVVLALTLAMSEHTNLLVDLLGPFCVTGFFWWFGLLFVIGAQGARRRDQAEAPAREQALLVWQELYYCPRDNVAFEPGVGLAFHPSETREYIFGFRYGRRRPQ
ncbi:hypothetical protein [Nonomuraea dietziae]|uniref:hypothetical protein n=1 Tax=Nonomuraea dietziae TaxID=65515 RepID=UPI00341EA8AF